MNEKLQRATQLLQDGDPEQALLLLGESGESSIERKQLEAACKKSLSEQYLWLLNDAAKGNRTDEIQEYVRKYLQHLGSDDRVEKYVRMTNSTASLKSGNKQFFKSLNPVKFKFALIPIAVFLLIFLIELLGAYGDKLGITPPSYLLNYVVSFLRCVNVVIIVAIFWWIGTYEKRPMDNVYCYCLLMWGCDSLLAGIADFIYGFHYDSISVLQGIRMSLVIVDILLIIFLVKQVLESRKFKKPLIFALTATGLDLIRLSLFLYVAYAQNFIMYNYDKMKLCSIVTDVATCGRVVLLSVCFVMIYMRTNHDGEKVICN